jgi:Asp-tRNA(Asn)/Glu-tRNA(Gln) amidotransferase A subunit family amidase
MHAHFVAKKDAAVVALIKREGAIPIVRGNTPQLAWVGHTDNRVFGLAKNPYDPTRTTSGSSGGDAGLVASKCVPFALGTDIGGSVRAPAACNGILGFKPTSQRSSMRGGVNCVPGYSMPQNAIVSCAGPLCNSVDDIKLYCKALWSE